MKNRIKALKKHFTFLIGENQLEASVGEIMNACFQILISYFSDSTLASHS